MSVRLPRLLDGSMQEAMRLHPSSLRLELTLEPLSQAVMVLPESHEFVAPGDFVELYKPVGSAGIFRVVSTETDYGPGGVQTVWLEHGLCTLSDDLIAGEHLYHGLSGGVLSSAFISSQTSLLENPSGSAAVLATLKVGTGVTLEGESGGWYHVSCMELSGYVPVSCVTKSTESGPFPISGTVQIAGGSRTYLRAKPSTSSNAITPVLNGAAVIAVGAQGSWYMASVGNVTGWLQKAYVSLNGMTDAKTPVGSMVSELLDNHQSVQRWEMGECAVTSALGFTFSNENLLHAVLRSTHSVSTPVAWSFDQSSSPWKLHLTALSQSPSCELRLSRNIAGLRVTVDRGDMYTALTPIGKDGAAIDGINGGSPQLVSAGAAVWGKVARVYRDADEDDLLSLKAAAESELSRHDAPIVSVEVDALELSRQTGEALDKLTLGALCRIPLPEKGIALEERIIGILWEDVLHEPDKMKVFMANRLQNASGLLAGIDGLNKIR